MTTAAGTSIWLIRLPAVNAPTARMAETAVARVVRRSWARAHRLVAGSSMRPSSAMPKANSAPIRCSIGFQRSAAATAGTARAASCSAGDPRAFRAVEHSTRPDTSAGCRRYGSWATMPPMEYPTAANPRTSRTPASAAISSAQSSSRNRGRSRIPSPWPRRSAATTRKSRPSGAKTIPQFSSAVHVTLWISMSVCAPGGSAHSHTRTVPWPGSSTSRVNGIASPSIRRSPFRCAPGSAHARAARPPHGAWTA